MQTRQYKDLFRLITSMIGPGGELPASGTEDTQVANFINRRFQEAFDESPVWPRYLVPSEERDIVSIVISGLTAGSSSDKSSVSNGNYVLFGVVSAGTGAVIGTNIYYNIDQGTENSAGISNSTILYKRTSTSRWELESGNDISLNSDGTISYEPGGGDTVLVETIPTGASSVENPSEVLNWNLTASLVAGTPLFTDKQLIPYAETGKNTIGDFNRIHRSQAFINKSAVEYEFFVDFDGGNILNLISSDSNKAFVTYKKQFTPFSVTTDFYNSTVEVPAEFFNFIAHAVYADFLRVQNKQQQAIAEEQVARTYLNLELEKIDIRSNNSTINKRFSTYVNRQSR